MNEGLGLTRNRGVREARGDYICFIDSDDYIDKQYIETIYFDLKKHAADVLLLRTYKRHRRKV